MRRAILLAFIVMLLPLLLHGGTHKVSKEVRDIIDSGEKQVNVIIKLKEDKKGNAYGLSIASGIKEKGRIHRLNIISATVDEAQLKLLEEDPNVEAVYYDFPVYITLHQSVPLVNADDVFSITHNGTQINGSGYSVCVIDTGVNYSHPALGGCTEEQFLNGNCPKVVGGYDVYNNDANPMDDHGHGTHVAGIVASTDSTYKGVAPGASIVALKALNASGSGTYYDIIEAMQWCLNNASKYNITAISMSLGNRYPVPSYCDDGDPFFSGLVNDSVAAGIPVVIATGNEYSTTGVSWPACLAQATRVSATTKSDVVAIFANRGANFSDIIMAPGVNIVSTSWMGGFEIKSGTSMATPHVSGAIALMRDYWEHVNNATLSPAEIKERLNYTKVRIDDTGGSGLYYPRLDVLEAVRPKPSFAGPTPANGSNTSQYFLVNITSPTPLSSATLELTYPNSTRINFSMASNSPYSFSIFAPTVQFGQYNFTVFTNDSANTSGFPLVRTVNVIASVSLDSPTDGYAQSTRTFALNCSFSTFGRNASNITLYGNFTGTWAANQTITVSGNETNASFTVDVLPGTYAWNCYGMDEYGMGFFAPQNYTFTYDPYPPAITPLSPGTLEVLARNSTLNISALITDEAGISYAYANLSLPNGTVLTFELASIGGGLYSNITEVPDIGCMHNITFYANDSFGNANQSNISYLARPCHTLFTASPSIKTNNATPVNITVNLTVPAYGFLDNYTLVPNDTAHASPSSVILSAAPASETEVNFTVAYTRPGNYSLTINSTQSAFPALWHALNFQCEVTEAPRITYTSITPYIGLNGSGILLNATATPGASVWANITKPDGATEVVPLPATFANTSLAGRYNVTFIANDSWSATTADDYFEVYEGALLNVSVYGPANAGTPARVSLYYRGMQVAENSSLDGNQTLYAPNASGYAVSISDYAGTITVILEGAQLDFGSTFRFGLYNSTNWSPPGTLASYGLENATPFANATVRIYYADLPYTNESRLRLYKCSGWDFENRRCVGNEADITANSTQNLTADYFEVKGTTLSGFAVVQGAWCGDGSCNGGETCSTCRTDCGACQSGGGGGGGGSGGGGSGSGGGSGGGGGGGGTAILPKDARYRNITSPSLFGGVAALDDETVFVDGERYELYYENGTFCGLRLGSSIINSTEDVSGILRRYAASFGTPESLRTAVLDGLHEFNNSRTAEMKCREQFGHHLFPCVDQESCLRGCRLVPLCTPLSYSEIVLNMSAYLYAHSEELSRVHNECVGMAANVSTYEDLTALEACVQKLSDESTAISSSPLFGSCSTCLSVCPDTNYSYDGLRRAADAIANASLALQAASRAKVLLGELNVCLARPTAQPPQPVNESGEIVVTAVVPPEPLPDNRTFLSDALIVIITTALLLHLGRLAAKGYGGGSGQTSKEAGGPEAPLQPQS